MGQSQPRRSGSLPSSAVGPDPDPEWAEYTAWVDREIAAGRDPDEAPAAWTDD
jgi:hypothetical protein